MHVGQGQEFDPSVGMSQAPATQQVGAHGAHVVQDPRVTQQFQASMPAGERMERGYYQSRPITDQTQQLVNEFANFASEIDAAKSTIQDIKKEIANLDSAKTMNKRLRNVVVVGMLVTAAAVGVGLISLTGIGGIAVMIGLIMGIGIAGGLHNKAKAKEKEIGWAKERVETRAKEVNTAAGRLHKESYQVHFEGQESRLSKAQIVAMNPGLKSIKEKLGKDYSVAAKDIQKQKSDVSNARVKEWTAIIIGGLFSLTIVGMIVGLPLLAMGIKTGEATDKKEKEIGKAERQLDTKAHEYRKLDMLVVQGDQALRAAPKAEPRAAARGSTESIHYAQKVLDKIPSDERSGKLNRNELRELNRLDELAEQRPLNRNELEQQSKLYARGLLRGVEGG
ncbi:MAG: hypothetical protein H0X51_08070 [Parachlamydiaceae bacterium]|nr:hypothetical protein [Parachlamydiaceae bacterium]